MTIVSKLLLTTCLFLTGIGCTQSQKKESITKIEGKAMTSAVLDTNWTAKVAKSNEEWAKFLTPSQFEIARRRGTERPFSSPLNDNKHEGIYYCVACHNPLYATATKFNSGTGWPSFWAPISSKSVAVGEDNSHGMVRDEVTCAKCDAHLGHVFSDGPKPTGQRYCMNGEVLKFEETQQLEKAIFAQGCFWCVEEIFEMVKGVEAVVSGYAGGKENNPTYEQVGSGSTGHAEAVEVLYDPKVVTYADLLKVYFNSGDITQVEGQGPDNGRQYRSILFYNSTTQKQQIEAAIQSLNQSGQYDAKVSIDVLPATKFYPAEDYHQDYVKLNPNQSYVKAVSIPRYKKAVAKFPELLKVK